MNASTNQDASQSKSSSTKATELMAEGYEWHETHGLWFGGEGYKHVLNADGTPANNNSDLWKKCGRLAFRCTGEKLPLLVLKSNAGFYIGTVVSTGDMRGAPNTRESDRYWQTEPEARSALETGNWVQKHNL